MRIHIRNFIICTDQGPDQKGAQAYIDHNVTSQLTCLVWRQWCFQHIGHLMVKRQLTCADSFFPQHFSGLAKFVNTWRGAQNAKKIAAVWKDRCPGTIDACRKLPPRPFEGGGAQSQLARSGCSTLRGGGRQCPTYSRKHSRRRWSNAHGPIGWLRLCRLRPTAQMATRRRTERRYYYSRRELLLVLLT